MLNSAAKVEFKSFRHNPSGTTKSHILSCFVAYDAADPCRSIHGANGQDAVEFDSCGRATGHDPVGLVTGVAWRACLSV